MSKKNARNKKRRWVLSIVLALTLVINGSFLVQVYAEEYAASIGTVNYLTLDEAFAAVTEGQTIRLLGPVEIGQELETGIVNKPGIGFYLDLGNQVISGDQEEALIQVAAGNLTVYNGQIINRNVAGLAISTAAESTAKIAFPIGYQKPEPLGAQLDIPAAFHVDFTNSGNGAIRYNAANGLQLPLEAGNLYAGENTTHNFYFVPAIGYKVGTFTINAVKQTVANQYKITNLVADQTVNVTFTKITFTIIPKVFTGDAAAPQGVVLTPAKAIVEYGGNQTFKIAVNEGYRLKDVLINNVSKGPLTTVTLSNVTKDQTVTIKLEKTALFIMLDSGHYEYYNHSPVVSSYYEGNAMWILHGYLKAELEKYAGIIVKTTRSNNTKAIGSALGPWERGAMGAGYDFVLSLHSNAASTSSAAHVVGICTQDPRFTTISRGLGAKLTSKVEQIMNTGQTPKTYTKTQSDGQDWYGINRGATSVGVPSLILEHSFHTNLKSTLWLMQSANLKALAVAEAKVIADYYGVSTEGTLAAPKTPPNFDAYGISYTKNKIKWTMSEGATGYQVYRATSKYGTYSKIKTTSTYELIDEGLACGTIYYYKVRAYRNTPTGLKYSATTAVNPARPIPSKPALTGASTAHRANLSWNVISGAQGYQIYRTSGTSGTWTKVKTITSGSIHIWSNTGLYTGKTYSYKVRAYRIVGGKAVFSVCSIPKTLKIK